MNSTRAMYATEQDASWSPIKRAKRQDYLKSVIREFLGTRKELAFFVEKEEPVSEMVRMVLLAYEHLRVAITNRVAHKQGNPALYDRHKIIAGTQLAILTVLPLRTRKTINIAREDVLSDCAKYLDVISLNADLAVYIALDILWQWVGLTHSGFDERPTLGTSCKALLANYCHRASNAPRDNFPIFWCSALWYTIEEILSFRNTLNKYGIP